MIQRIQNLYLLLAIICLVIAIFTPISYVNFKENDYSGELLLSPTKIELINDNFDIKNENLNQELITEIRTGKIFLLFLWNTLLILLITLTIFKFKNLKKQLSLNRINLILSAFTLIALAIGLFILPNYLKLEILEALNPQESLMEFIYNSGIGFYLYFVAVSFIALANIGIRKDVKILKSIDRIR